MRMAKDYFFGVKKERCPVSSQSSGGRHLIDVVVTACCIPLLLPPAGG